MTNVTKAVSSVGDIFGAPLAIEALMAFFVESTFIGLWIFGWDKLPKKVHLLTIWMVAIDATVSSLWILIANSWMQHSVGLESRPGLGSTFGFTLPIPPGAAAKSSSRTGPKALLLQPSAV